MEIYAKKKKDIASYNKDEGIFNFIIKKDTIITKIADKSDEDTIANYIDFNLDDIDADLPDLPDETTIKVEDASDADFVTEVDGLEISGDVFNVTIVIPGGTGFEDSYILTLASDEHADDIYYYNENEKKWEHQDGNFNDDKSEITIETNHFSTYGVFAIDEKAQVAVVDNHSTPTKSTVEDDEINDNDEDVDDTLPSTSTSIFNWMLIGAILVVVATVFLIFKKRKSG